MRSRLCLMIVLVSLLAATAAAAEIAIDGPKETVVGTRPTRLNIVGIKVADLIAGGAGTSVYPRDAEAWDAASWNGDAYLLFWANKAGTYLVEVAFVHQGKLVWLKHEIAAKGDGPNPPPPPPPPNPYTAVEEWKAAVSPLSKFKLKSPDGEKLAAAWAEASKFARAAPAGSTTADLRKKLLDLGKPLGLQGSYAGLASAADKILAEALSLDVRPLDGPRAADLLQTMAWAAWEASR